MFYLYIFSGIPILRQHPRRIMIQKCFFELLFISQFFWILSPQYPNSFFWNHDTNNEIGTYPDCVASSSVKYWAFLTQFSLAGSELFLFWLSIDLYRSLTNPFHHFKRAVRNYILIVWILSIISASILIYQGDKIYGLGTLVYVCISLLIYLSN